MLTSCIFMHFDNSVDLGAGYYYVPDGDFSSIVKSKKETYDGIGEEIVPPIVTNYNYNTYFIIVKSVDSEMISYWIIDKNRTGKITPLDSLSFYRLNKQKKTGLTFEKLK